MGLPFVISILFLLVVAWSLRTSINDRETLSLSKNSHGFIISLFLLFLGIRLLLAILTPGYTSDMSCWSAWGQRLASIGPSNFYTGDYFCDYPPGYLYILGFNAKLVEILHLPEITLGFLNKIPPVISDSCLAILIYKSGTKALDNKGSLWPSILFLITPIFWYDSAIWGQIDSVLLLFLTLTLLHLYQKKYLIATITYVLAILIKPQGLILAPIFLCSLLEGRNIKQILLSASIGIFLFLTITLPFSPAWRNGSSLLQALNPIWLIEKYSNTLASYPYFTVNAFNLYGIFQLNWVPLDTINTGLSTICNLGIMLLGLAGSLYLFFRIKSNTSKLFLSSYFLFGFLYTFAFKMHERYIVLPLFFLLLEYVYTKNKRVLIAFTGLSVVGFLNLSYVLQLVLTTNQMPDPRLVTPISILEVLFFFYSVYIICQDYLRYPEQRKKSKINFSCSLFYKKPIIPVFKSKKMTQLDSYVLSAIVLVYSLFAFTNLGSTKSPETYYQPSHAGETFTITLQESIMLTEINYFCGIGDVDTYPGIEFSYSDDGNIWTSFPETSCVFESVFRWETETIDPVYLKFLRGTFVSTDYSLYEIGFRDGNGKLARIETIQGDDQSILKIADEQTLVTNKPSYQNGTYFDEIYHARTAYEHLHMLPYYETTHPPLGKLIITLGIALFGMTPFGWRFSGAMVGVLMLPIFYFILKHLFQRTRYAGIGTLLFAFDFMHYSLTRIATIDSFPVLFILCMYYFMYCYGKLAIKWAKGEIKSSKKQLLYLFLSGLFMGLGCASKWTAVYASVGLGIEFLVILCRIKRNLTDDMKEKYWKYLIKTCSWCLLFFCLIPLSIYTLSYLPISLVDGYGNVFSTMWENQEYMLTYHSGISGTHPYSSKWYTWPFVYRPMWAYQAPEGSIPTRTIGCISIFQNPLISWVGIIAFFTSLYIGWKKKDHRVLFLVIGLLSQYLPWILVRRYALQYHFFATLPFLILFLVYTIEYMETKWRSTTILSNGLTALSLLLFLGFYPVLTGIPVSRFYAETFLTWFESWVFFL